MKVTESGLIKALQRHKLVAVVDLPLVSTHLNELSKEKVVNELKRKLSVNSDFTFEQITDYGIKKLGRDLFISILNRIMNQSDNKIANYYKLLEKMGIKYIINAHYSPLLKNEIVDSGHVNNYLFYNRDDDFSFNEDSQVIISLFGDTEYNKDKLIMSQNDFNGFFANINSISPSLRSIFKSTILFIDFDPNSDRFKSIYDFICQQNGKYPSEAFLVSEITAGPLSYGKNENLIAGINEIKAEANEFRKKASNSNADVSNQLERRNELEKRSTELRVLERNKTEERSNISSELVRLDERKIAMRKEYDELNDMLFEQYELTRREAENLNIVIEDMAAAKRRLNEIKHSIKKLGSINVGAIEEYKEVSERYEFLKEQIDDIEKSKNELLKIIEDLTASMSEKFLEKFNKINEEFKVCFADFFGGGKGEIKLENPDNCLESAIEINIQPPGKAVQNISLFSGGEKSLAAMALLFSVLKVQPAPFCIYDEVEAALDDVNVERFAKYMRKMTDRTQFISITHRRGTMEEADVLYGVTMQEKGVSKLIELQTAELAAQMGLEE